MTAELTQAKTNKGDARVQWFDTIRILGLVLVLTYHFFKESFPGGFLGVDLFFVLSGYLAAESALRRCRRTGRLGIGEFCGRRFARLFPPLLLTIIFTIPLTLLISSDFTVGIGRQIAAALGFVTNYYEIRNGGSYEAQMLPHLFVHTWYLSLLVQLLLIFVAVLLVIGGVRRVVRLLSGDRSRLETTASSNLLAWLVAAISLILAGAAFAHMQTVFAANPVDPAPAYFGISRAYPFLLGVTAGALFGELNLDRRLLGSSVSGNRLALLGFPISLAGLVVASRYFSYSQAFTYRAGILLAALITIAAIAFARHLSETLPLREPMLVGWLAELSFGIYLFHWPLYVVAGQRITTNWLAAVVALVVAFFLAIVVQHGFDPVIARRLIPSRRRLTTLAVPLTLSTLLAVPVFAKAPELSSLEQDLLVGYLHQDRDAVVALLEVASEPVDPTAEEAGEEAAERAQDPAAQPAPAVVEEAVSVPDASFDAVEPVASPETEAEAATEAADAPANETAEPATAIDGTEPEAAPASDAEAVAEPAPADAGAETQPLAEPAPERQPEPEQPATDATATEPTPVQAEAAAPATPTPSGVSVIGDSVCLGARTQLLATIPDSAVDAKGSRNLKQGLELMNSLQAAGKLRETVVISLGTNVRNDAVALVDQIVEQLAPGHRLVFVTPYSAKAGGGSLTPVTAEHIRALADQFPFVTVADWAEAASANRSVLGPDGIHIGGKQDGIELYTGVITDALAVAAAGPAK